MASLDDLPTEILQMIFSNFCLRCHPEHDSTAPDAYFRGTRQHARERSWYSLQRHGLFSLCLTSRRFHAIAQSILYHEFILGYGDSWRSIAYTWDGRLTFFMRTVAQRPELAALVKRVYIHSYLLAPISEKETRNAVRQAAYALGIEPWHQSTRDLVPILVAQLPNLERLSFQRGPGILKSVRLLNLQAAHIPRRLKTVDISKYSASKDNLFILDFSAFAIMELAASLETLNLHMCCGVWQGVIPFLPKLNTLRITHSRLRRNDLSRLLSSCGDLHSFVYEATGTSTASTSSKDHFNPFHALQILTPHRKTLKSLHLDLRALGLSPCGEGNKHQPVSNFKEFMALEHLHLNTDRLYGSFSDETEPDSQRLVQILPPNIVSLHLEGYVGQNFSWLPNALLGLADAVSQKKFLKLERVRCKRKRGRGKYYVGARFADFGVDFAYEKCSWPPSEATIRRSDPPAPPSSFEPMAIARSRARR